MPSYASCDALTALNTTVTNLSAQVDALAAEGGADGSETKILPKDTTVTVTGAGTAADPYKIGAVPGAATNAAAGVVQLNDGTATGDATNAADALTAAGLGTLLASTAQPPNALQAVVAQAANKVSVKDLGTLTLGPTTADSRVVFADTAPAGWNVGAGRMSFSADVQFNNYFANNPNGHMAIVLRQDPALVATAVRGQGVAIGNLVGAPEGTQTNPGIQAEAWSNGNAQQNRLIPSTSAPTKLADGVPYKILVESSVGHDGRKYVRYALYKVVATGVDVVYDSGDVLDTLAGVDMTQSAVMVGHVFGAGGSGWDIAFTNAKVTWGPFGEKNTDFSAATAVQAARSSLDNTAFAVAISVKLLTIGAARTWTTIKNSDSKKDAEFGLWNADGSVFTFTQAGSFQFDVSGLLLGQADNAGGTLKRINAGVYADFGTFTKWAGQLSQLIETEDGVTFATGVATTVRIPNVAIGQTFKLVAYTDPNPGMASLALGWGVAGGVQGTPENPAASGVMITRY